MKQIAPQHQHFGTFGLGDRERFWFEVEFEPYPDGGPFDVDEEVGSWGSFQMWVDGRNLCRQIVGVEESQAVHWHLLPLMEWFSENWDYLFHEQRPPTRNAGETGWASPTLSQDDVLTLARALVNHSTEAKAEDKLQLHSAYRPPTRRGDPPWLEGYQLAQEWTRTSRLDSHAQGHMDIDEHFVDWGIVLKETELSDDQIGGVAIASTGRAPLVLLNKTNPRNQFPSGRRFSLAHELCHLLYDRLAGKELALISGPWAPVELEKRANAFAAMLLMPDRLVEEAFLKVDSNPSRPTFKDLLEAARRLEVSADALGHHLANRGWITTDRRDLLLEQLSNR